MTQQNAATLKVPSVKDNNNINSPTSPGSLSRSDSKNRKSNVKIDQKGEPISGEKDTGSASSDDGHGKHALSGSSRIVARAVHLVELLLFGTLEDESMDDTVSAESLNWAKDDCRSVLYSYQVMMNSLMEEGGIGPEGSKETP